jgi:hypothetical protein
MAKHTENTINSKIGEIILYGSSDRKAAVAFFATVQNEGGRQVEHQIEYFNLDAIISVGYRVNSKRGTQFRIWATNVLRDHLVRGFTLNEKRLGEQEQKLVDLRRTVGLLEKTLVRRRHVHRLSGWQHCTLPQ